MRILAIDQARNCGWSIFDYDTKKPVLYGVFSFPDSEYTYAQALVGISDMAKDLMLKHNASAVFIEDTQLQKNADSFKKLAQLQGALISLFERNEFLYDIIKPSTWQGYCGARGRTTKELKENAQSIQSSNKRQTKILSIQYVKDKFGIETENDNLADALCIGDYVVNNIRIELKEK